MNQAERQAEANQRAFYTESGWRAEVEILEDNSNADEYRYRLKVVKTFTDGILGRLPDGHVFTAFSVKKYTAYCGWTLEKK